MDSLGEIKAGSLEEVMSTIRLTGYKRSLTNKEMAENKKLSIIAFRRKKLQRKGYFMQRHHRVCEWGAKVFKQKRMSPEFSSVPKLRSTYCNCRILIICEMTCVMSTSLHENRLGHFIHYYRQTTWDPQAF